MSTLYQIILCTCHYKDSAEQLAHLLVNEQLNACVNISLSISSIYWWQGQATSAQEYLLLIKAHKDHYKAIEPSKKHITLTSFPKLLPSLLNTVYPNTCTG